MGTKTLATNDFSLEPVPDHHSVNGWYVALVIFGIGFTLPIYLLGSELGQRLGLYRSVISFVSGCAATGVLASMTSYVGAQSRLSSYVIIQVAFGRSGARMVNLLMAAALLGYFASTADIFGQVIGASISHLWGISFPRFAYSLAGVVLMTVTAALGFGAIKRLSSVAVPAVALVLTYAVYLAVHRAGWSHVAAITGNPEDSTALAVSTVIGSCVVGAIVMPDVTRFARTGLDGVKAAAGSTIGYPIIFTGAALATLATGQIDLMKILIGLGLVTLSLITLVLSTWANNTNNLYSASLTLATVFPAAARWQLTLAASVIGAFLVLFGVADYLLEFFLLLGIVLPPIAGVYLADFFLISRGVYDISLLDTRRAVNWRAFASWLVGGLVGYASSRGLVHVTAIPSVDSIVTAAGIYIVVTSVTRRVKAFKA